MKILFAILLLTTTACNSAGDNATVTDTAIAKRESNNAEKVSESKNTSSAETDTVGMTNDSTILITFPRDSTWVTVAGKINGVAQPITVSIPVKQGKQLTATLVPEDSIANIRINQIFTPSGKADGPFGRELKRKLHEQGTYKLILAENMMQGEEWKGKFKLTIRVE